MSDDTTQQQRDEIARKALIWLTKNMTYKEIVRRALLVDVWHRRWTLAGDGKGTVFLPEWPSTDDIDWCMRLYVHWLNEHTDGRAPQLPALARKVVTDLKAWDPSTLVGEQMWLALVTMAWEVENVPDLDRRIAEHEAKEDEVKWKEAAARGMRARDKQEKEEDPW